MKSFRGGIHPLKHGGKLKTRDLAVRELIPGSVLIPMSMHIGAPSTPCVKVGDRVLMGQVIGEPNGFLGIPVHASVSGTVTAVGPRQQMGASPVMCVEIENDFSDELCELHPIGSVNEADPKAIVEAIKNAGICGMGGAAFPTHVKFAVPEGKKAEAVIVNGAECETHITADARLMQEQPERVIAGLRAAMRALGVSRGIICIENNKPEAIAAIRRAAEGEEGISVLRLKVKYPQGSEKQLLKSALGREIPVGGLPIDAGAIVINAATAAAIADAVELGMPLIKRITTVTGAVNAPANFLVRIGTQLTELVGACEGFSGEVGKVIMGGTMTGSCAHDFDVSIIKGMGGVIVCEESDAHTPEESPCIRCARCVDVCPMGLSPHLIKAACDKNDMSMARDYHVMDCINCGCCTFTCPASRKLSPSFKIMKEKIQAELRRAKG